jgi:hypothetical protein
MLSTFIIANTTSSASLINSSRLHLIQAYTASLCHSRQILTAHQTFPNLFCASFLTCHHPYPDGPSRCLCLFLGGTLRSSLNTQRLDTRNLCPANFARFPGGHVWSRGCNVRFMLRPVRLLAPLNWPPLLSRGSGTFTSELSRNRSPSYESDITTWVNRQFPGRDLTSAELSRGLTR